MILEEVKSKAAFELAAQLFTEYASHLDIDLSFQDFNNELLKIEEQYSRPDGGIILAYGPANALMGCIGVRRYSNTTCELKRMYVRQSHREKGVGRRLLQQAITLGQDLHFEKMRLDTLSTMEAAITLYLKMGFYEINSYRFNPIEGAKFFEIQL